MGEKDNMKVEPQALVTRADIAIVIERLELKTSKDQIGDFAMSAF